MHELGIVMQVIDQVEQVAEQNAVAEVLRVNLEIGEVSGIVPKLFADCYEWAKKKTKHLQNAKLEMIILEGVSYCRDCKTTYQTTKYAKQCPRCGGNNTYLVTGNEINIRDIQVAD